jgi:[ribosomal protein S5]-alanine N-acetyltransferase
VFDAETDRCLGMVNYHDGHIRSKRVPIGYIIDPARHRQGLATEAVSAMLDFCFSELGLHRVQAFIHPDASRTLVEKLGFRCEGSLRDNLRVGDVWRNDMLYLLLESDRRSQA